MPQLDAPARQSYQPAPRRSFSDRIAACLDDAAAAGLPANFFNVNPQMIFSGSFVVNNDGKTWYDSLQSKVERRFGSLNFIASYVWSKTLSQMTYRQIFSQGANANAQDAYNIPDSKSYAFEDFPHFVNILATYNLPIGKGKKFLGSARGPVNAIVGGWTT